MDGVVDADTNVGISSSTNAWTSLPSNVTVTNGNDSVTFGGTLNTTCGGAHIVITATANGTSVNTTLLVTPQ